MIANLAKRGGCVSVVAGCVTALASCGDSSGSAFTQQEKTAVATALLGSGALGASPFAGFAPFAILVVDQLGSIGSPSAGAAGAAMDAAVVAGRASFYEQAFGMVVTFEITSQGQTTTGFITGVIGWNGLDAQAQTVDELVTAALVGVDVPTLTSGAYTIESGTAFASYFDGSQAYFATTGSVDINSSFGGSIRDCSQSGQGYTVACSYQAGTMSGQFGFEATGVETGTYTQDPVTFSVPAVQVNLTIVS